MSQGDTEYYRQRAMIERQRAQSAPTPQIALIHEELAELYENFIKAMNSPANDPTGQVAHEGQPNGLLMKDSQTG